jgi:hypothetical protein
MWDRSVSEVCLKHNCQNLLFIVRFQPRVDFPMRVDESSRGPISGDIFVTQNRSGKAGARVRYLEAET